MDDKNHHSALQGEEVLPRLQFGHLHIATNEHSFIKLQKLRYAVSKIECFRQENTMEVNKAHFCSQMCFFKNKLFATSLSQFVRLNFIQNFLELRPCCFKLLFKMLL